MPPKSAARLLLLPAMAAPGGGSREIPFITPRTIPERARELGKRCWRMLGFMRRYPRYYTAEGDLWIERWQKSCRCPFSFKYFAMDPIKKQKIMAGLDLFRKAKKFYSGKGQLWKKSYLVHGPPRTGKSAMIMVIAEYTNYDMYRIDLTAVTETDLCKLLMKTTSKSIIIFEDIERSTVDLTGLIDFMDGMCFGACGGEKMIMFTTSHVEDLDPALIRRGQMEVIEMSYCRFDAFKVFAHNCLGIDSHPLFERIEEILRETNITAEAIGKILVKALYEDREIRIARLIDALQMLQEKNKY